MDDETGDLVLEFGTLLPISLLPSIAELFKIAGQYHLRWQRRTKSWNGSRFVYAAKWSMIQRNMFETFFEISSLLLPHTGYTANSWKGIRDYDKGAIWTMRLRNMSKWVCNEVTWLALNVVHLRQPRELFSRKGTCWKKWISRKRCYNL